MLVFEDESRCAAPYNLFASSFCVITFLAVRGSQWNRYGLTLVPSSIEVTSSLTTSTSIGACCYFVYSVFTLLVALASCPPTTARAVGFSLSSRRFVRFEPDRPSKLETLLVSPPLILATAALDPCCVLSAVIDDRRPLKMRCWFLAACRP